MNKQRKITQLLAAILALSTVGTTLFACAENKDDDTVQSVTTEAGTTAAEEIDYDSLEARRLVSDNLPERNFNGEKFRVLTYNSQENYIATPESQEGDVVEDAVFERNKKIEERFGITIEVNNKVSHRETGTMLEQTVHSADDAFEIYAGHAIVSGGNAVNDMFLNWYDIDYVDFTKPWWNQNSVEALTLNDILFLVPSYFTATVIDATYCMYYNKVIAENNNLDSIYDVVNNQEWTLDYLLTMVQDAYRDLNGNSRVDSDDAFGLAMSGESPAVTFTWAFDMDILEIDEDFVVEIVYSNERNADIYAKIYDLIFNTTGVTAVTSNQNYGVETFVKANTLLCAGTFQNAYRYLRDFEDDYAIIPYPKYDDQQEEYYSMLDGFHAVIGVPMTAQNLELAGIITEAMTAESWKEVVPAYYDVALKTKGVRDEESIAMMDLIMDSVKVDFTYIYDNWQGYAFTIQDLLRAKNKNFASAVKAKARSVEKWYDKVVAAFVEYGQE